MNFDAAQPNGQVDVEPILYGCSLRKETPHVSNRINTQI